MALPHPDRCLVLLCLVSGQGAALPRTVHGQKMEDGNELILVESSFIQWTGKGEPERSINLSVVFVDRDLMLYGFRRSILCFIFLPCTGVWILHIYCHALTMKFTKLLFFRGLPDDSITLNGFILLLRDHVIIRFSYRFLNRHMILLQTLSHIGNEKQHPICMKLVLLSKVCFVPILTIN